MYVLDMQIAIRYVVEFISMLVIIGHMAAWGGTDKGTTNTPGASSDPTHTVCRDYK